LDRKTGQIDKLIGIKEKQIELLKEQRTALINQAVTKGLNPNAKLKPSGIDWLGDIPEDWQVVPLKYMLKTTKGYAFKSVDFCDSGVRVVRATDIKNGSVLPSSVFLPKNFLESHSQVRLNSGDLIISTVGSNPDVINSAVGQVGLVPEELDGALLNQNTVILSSIDDRLCSYLLYILNSTSYRKFLDLHAHGTANQSSLKLFDILKFKAAIPPLNEQKLIVESIEKNSAIISTEITKLQKQIELLKEYRTALISEAVTGKIDVREDL
jgi:type I restriction enzyme S subunit